MKIGVRFCGGCNPRYDRGAAFRKIKRELEGTSAPAVDAHAGLMSDTQSDALSLEHAVEGVPYDGLLVIGGCQACCAGYDQFDNRGPVVKLWSEEGIPAAIQLILAAPPTQPAPW